MKQFLRFKVCVFLTLLLSTTSLHSFSQDGTQAYKPLVGTGVTVQAISNGTLGVGTNFTGLSNVVDVNLTNYAFNAQVLAVNSVNGVSVTSATSFPANSRAGFVVQIDASLISANLLNGLTLSTFNNGTEVMSRTGAALNINASALTNTSSGKLYLNFASSGVFNEVRLTINNTLALSTGNLKVFYAMAFSGNAGINENNAVCEDQIAGAATSVSYNGGLLNVATSLENPSAINNGNKNSSAALFLPAGTSVLTSPIYVGVTDLVNVFPLGNKAGFVIRANSSLLGTSVLNNIKIQTYLFGEFQEESSFNSGAGTLGVSVLNINASDKKKLEFTTTKKFNEVRIVFGSGIDVNVAVTDIFYAYESGSTCGDCSTGLFDNTPDVADFEGSIVSGSTWTGTFGVCASLDGTTGLSAQTNVLTPVQTDFATFSATLGLGCGGRLTIQSSGTMPVGSFAGFEIAQDNSGLLGLLSLSALNAVTVSIFNGTNSVGSVSGASLLGTSILGGTGSKTIIGFRSSAAFNRIQIEINSGLLSVATKYRIYRAFVIRDNDNDGIPDCQDVCSGNDAIDSDGDGIPDACDACNNVNLPAPILNSTSVSNICPAATASFSSIVASNVPSGTPTPTLSFHTATPATDANKVADASSVAAPGTYYAVFTQGAGCYGGDGANTTAVTVTANTCIAASDPPVQTAYVGQAKTGNAATELAPTGGVTPYTYSRVACASDPTSALPGTITFSPTGSPNYSYTAPNTSGTYYYCIQVCDANNVCVTKTYTLQVGALQAPIAEVDNIGAVQGGTAVNGSLKANDHDPQGSTLTYNTAPVQAPAHGVLAINATGTYSYTPAANYAGIDSFSYQVCNGFGLCSVQKVFVSTASISTANDAPLAAHDYPGVKTGSTLTSSVAGNDIDPDDNSVLTYSLVTGAQHGTFLLNSDGSYTYNPTTGFSGTDSVEYKVCDNGTPSSLCANAKVYIKVYVDSNGAVNDLPIAVNDVVKAIPGQNVSGNIGTNDTDPDGSGTLTYTIVEGNTSGFTLGANGSFNYTPASNFIGTVFITYSVCDGSGGCDTATLAIIASNPLPPDLTPTITLNTNNLTAASNIQNFTVNLLEELGKPTTGQIIFEVKEPGGFKVNFNNSISTITVNGAGTINVSNQQWEEVAVSNPGVRRFRSIGNFSIAAFARARIGFSVERTVAGPGTIAYIEAKVVADPTKTYDSNSNNNIVTVQIIYN